MVGSERQVYVKIFNTSSSTALSNGAIYVLSYYVDATDTSNPIIKGIAVAPSTKAANNVIIVIDNSPKDLTTIPASSYGWAVVAGYVQALCDGGTTDIAVGDQLEILNGGTAFTVETAAVAGASPILDPACAAIAMEAYTSGTNALKKVFLTGIPCNIDAS
jgi:hypothetical protein